MFVPTTPSVGSAYYRKQPVERGEAPRLPSAIGRALLPQPLLRGNVQPSYEPHVLQNLPNPVSGGTKFSVRYPQEYRQRRHKTSTSAPCERRSRTLKEFGSPPRRDCRTDRGASRQGHHHQ